MANNGLNERQYRFVHEYLKDLNAADAYRRAGYKAKGEVARANASRLLTNANVQAALVRVREEIAERTQVTKELVMAGLRENLERALQHKPVLDKEGNPIGVYVYDGHVANKSLELMGKELGMFKDKVEVSGGPEPIKQVTVVQHVRYDP
jgi:phage terminase small subunit